MFASLDRVDFGQKNDQGRICVYQTDHRDAAEIEGSRELSVLFAVLRLLNPPRMISEPVTEPPLLYYYLADTPPLFLIEAIAAAGGRVLVGPNPRDVEDVTGTLPRPPRPLEDIANEAMSSLARRTAAEGGFSIDQAGLGRLEKEVLADIGLDENGDVVLDLDDDGNEKRPADGGEAKWTSIVKLASLAGEVLRSQVQGRWVVDAASDDWFPMPFECRAGDKELKVQLLKKAIKLKENGQEDSVQLLVSTVIHMLRAPD